MHQFQRKIISSSLVFATAVISTFCFAECALAAPPPQETSSHHCQKETPTQDKSDHGAGESCCPAFVALVGSPVQPLDSLLETTADYIDPSQNLVEPIIISSQEFYFPSDVSPPRVFLATNSIHAPPALI